MKIEPGVFVELEYVLTDPGGEVLDSSEDEGPIEYEHGSGELPEALEKALAGKEIGDEIEIALGPDELFGAYDPAGIVQVSPEVFPEGSELEADLWVTLAVEGDDEDSSGELEARIVEVRPEAVVLDTNPPLAGKPLVIRAKVVRVGAE